MGRWEGTKKIKAFRGVWAHPSERTNRSKKTDTRTDQLSKASTDDLVAKDESELTFNDLQKLSDYYGVPLVQAKKSPLSTAEYVDQYCTASRLQDLLNDGSNISTDDPKLNEWIAGYDPNGGMTKQEYIKEIKHSLRRRGRQSNDQLEKLADSCGVDYTYMDDGSIVFEDSGFEEITASVLYAQDKNLYHLSPPEQRKMIKEKYELYSRDPSTDLDYIISRSIVRQYYKLEYTVDYKQEPIGKYRTFINNFDAVYRGFTAEEKTPTSIELILVLNNILSQTELYEDVKFAPKIDTNISTVPQAHPVAKLITKTNNITMYNNIDASTITFNK